MEKIEVNGLELDYQSINAIKNMLNDFGGPMESMSCLNEVLSLLALFSVKAIRTQDGDAIDHTFLPAGMEDCILFMQKVARVLITLNEYNNK